MTTAPSFNDIFAVMSAASVGDTAARVVVPDDGRPDDTETKFALALNVLLDDLSLKVTDAQRELAAHEGLAARLRTLADASREFSTATGDLQNLLDAVARRLGQELGDLCVIRLVSDDGDWLEPGGAGYHADPELVALMRRLALSGRQRAGERVRRVITTMQPVLIPTTDTATFALSTDPSYAPFLERFAVSSSLTVALTCRGKVVGIASFLRGGGDHWYDADDVRFVQGLADHAALAISNAQSYAAERVARAAAEIAKDDARALEARYRLLFDRSPLPKWVYDTTTLAFLEVNEAAVHAYGYSREEFLRMTVADIWPAEDLPLFLRSVTETGRSGQPSIWRQRTRDGSIREVEVHSHAFSIDGHDARLVLVNDVTERRRAEAAIIRLREESAAEVRFRAFIETAPDAMVIVGQDGRIVLVNAQTERLFGYQRDELLGKSVDMLVPMRVQERHGKHRADFVPQARSRPMGVGLDLNARRKDGTEFPVEISLSPLEIDGSMLVSSAIRDVTARKITETALVLANRELEAFSYSVAHDLRAPLRGMNGFARLLLETYHATLDAEGQDWLQEILLNAQKMAGLIDALLSLARVTRSEMKPQRVDLSRNARTIGAKLAAEEPERKVVLTVADDLHADIDRNLARALLENLLGNAWKFTQKRPDACVEVGASIVEGVSAFYVRDNGAGFDMAFAEKLFAPFQRLHTVDEFPGTGIGLATVQRIVHRHGGRIWAEGQVDHGATFYFTLPAHTPESPR